jgi:streptogramin lyase
LFAMRAAPAFIGSFLVVTLAGCSAMPEFNSTAPVSAASQGATIQGVVHGGQGPIVGAQVYLYAVNTTGYGGAGIAASTSNQSISLLTSATGNPADANGNYYVTTGSDGTFTLTSYTCPATASPVYLYAIGGNSGAGTNSAAVLLAGYNGDCPSGGSLSATLNFEVNEISTIATAYALAPFATDPTHISSSGTTKAQAGILHAADAAETLANILANGAARTELPAGNGTVPQNEIDTLANILAACVNSDGSVSSTPTPTPCYTLFTNALSGGTTGTMPADTATAAINIAHNPWANIGNLFALQGGSPPFVPDLGVAPNDYTIAINQTSGGLSTPFGIAVDGSGDVWVANNGSTGAGTTISEFNGNGAPQSDSPISGGGLNGPYLIAIDSNTNVWVTDNNTGTLSYFENNGTPIFANGFGDVSEPIGIAIDTSNDAWVANSCNSDCVPENSISVFTDSGGENTPVAGFTGGGLNVPVVVAIDTSGNVWVTNGGTGANSITELGSTGVKSGSPITGGGLDQPGDIVVDASGNLWIGDENSNSLSVYDPTTKEFISGASGYSGGGLNVPYGIAIDGAGNVWVANYGAGGSGNSISEFTSSGAAITSSSGYQGGLSIPYDIAVDSAGSVWVTNAGNSSITKFVGAASPVVTPIVANLLSPYSAHAVNKP